MNGDVPDKIVRGARILEELSYKYRYRVQDIADYLCQYLRDKAPSGSGHREKIQTEAYVVEVLRVIAALPRSDLNGHPLLINLNRIHIFGQTLTNVNFKRAILWGSDFIGCRLEWCDFEEADLGGCIFDKSSMEFVNLKNSKMWPSVYEDPKRATSLRGTKLGGANLEGAIIYGADFRLAIDVRKDDWEKTVRNNATTEPDSMY